MVSPRCAASAARLYVHAETLVRMRESSSDLESAIISNDDANKTSYIYISEELRPYELFIPYTPILTLKIKAANLVERMSTIASVEFSNFFDEPNQEIINDLPLSDYATAIITERITTNALTNSLKYHRMTTSTAIAKAAETAQLAYTKVQNLDKIVSATNQRLGFVETIRSKLQDEAGSAARKRRISSLKDIVKWVGDAIGAKEGEQLIALTNIIQLCVNGFQGYDQATNPKVSFEEVTIPQFLVSLNIIVGWLFSTNPLAHPRTQDTGSS
jgi:hypothetical protein